MKRVDQLKSIRLRNQRRSATGSARGLAGATVSTGWIVRMLSDNFEEYVNRDENPVSFLSIDPGESNGICGYDPRTYMTFMITVPADDMITFLEKFHKVHTCILEDFTLYPNKAKEQIYTDMETSRVIGRVEAWAERRKVKLIKQPAKIKPTGYKWIGKKPLPKTNPQNHALDAHVHFIYWAVRNSIIDPADLLRDTKVKIGKGNLQE